MVSLVHPEEKKEEAAGTKTPRKVSGVVHGALEGAALVVLGEDLDGTAGGNPANGKVPLASAFMRKNSTYFQAFTSKSDLGELGPVYRNVYAEMISSPSSAGTCTPCAWPPTTTSTRGL